MYINVAQLFKEPVGSTRRYPVDEYIGEEGRNHVRGEVTLTQASSSILAQGSMTAAAESACNRCLEPVDFSVNFYIEEQFFPSIDIVNGLPLPENPGSYTIDENHIIDLSEVLNQYLLMAMPMKVLCRPDCAGICPSCGHNCNEGSCKCTVEITDPRWSKLVNLKKGE